MDKDGITRARCHPDSESRLNTGNLCVTHLQWLKSATTSVSSGTEPFADWFAELDPLASAKVTRAVARIEQGNFSNVKSV
jgi:predicted SnoaL-like aldol condensation-catalyzing enzyme